MSKAYSNKALPPGTVLREWRLEDVLGVGGFGIVYRARGIYFDELVAIKEYFPSSISERDGDDTVVPVDSDAEEVHALGLKKFVEEAKLLWNLSTPSRHPNIVSVRSLFEIHGTAYMVMDFEDGISLSKLLKEGKKFNERSLLAVIRPIAEGLDRAHRVGVLHRDIKPPNILISDEGRPVLIDFGSARFEAAEATSTKVTFHTPPYAALEQYVKTLEQGPWTDIYGLGVVLFECVTGTKPPEVLERMHGSNEQALAAGRWPGYSERFLAGIDAAMAIRPTDRPQTVTEWLSLLEGKGGQRSSAIEVDEGATRVASFDMTAEQIVPVAAPPDGKRPLKAPPTRVPADPSQAKFKRSGRDTGAARKLGAAAAGVVKKPRGGKDPESEPVATAAPREDPARSVAPPESTAPRSPAAEREGRKLNPVLAGVAAVALVLATGTAIMFSRGGEPEPAPQGTALASLPAGPGGNSLVADAAALPAAVQSLADEAASAGAPGPVLAPLRSAGLELTTMRQQLQSAQADPAQSGEAARISQHMEQVAAQAGLQFAAALMRDTEQAARRLGRDVPWANPLAAAEGSGTGEQRRAAAAIRAAFTNLGAAGRPEGAPVSRAEAMAGAREALSQWQRFNAGVATAYRLQDVPLAPESERLASVEERPALPKAVKPVATALPVRTAAVPAAPDPAEDGSVSPAQLGRFNAILEEGRGMARQVVRLGERSRAGSTSESRAAHELLRANMKLARGYDDYLVKLRASMRGVDSSREADRLIKDASQTRAYLQFLVKRSSESAQ